VVTATDVLEAGTLPGNAGWGDATFNVTSGSIAVSHAGTTALSGSGPLVVIRFLVNPALLAGGSTTLSFQSLLFNEGVPNDTTANGSITVPATPSITVSPNTGEVVRGQTLQFSVSGSVSPPVSWSTTDLGIATINASGLLTGVAPGAVRVFAVDNAGRRDTTSGDIQVRGMGMTVGTGAAVQGNPGSVPVTVSDLTGLGIRAGQLTVTYNAGLVTPTAVTTAGTLLQNYGPVYMGGGGGTLTVDFVTSADLAGAGTLCVLHLDASPSNSGVSTLALTDALFNETLPAKKTNGSFTVNPLPSITVSPENVTLLAAQTQQFTVSGGPTPPITWSTLNPAVATIGTTGLLTAVAGGVTQVRAEDAVGASDENTSVTVYDFKVTVPTVTTMPGTKVYVPLLLDRNVDGLGIYSIQYTLIHSAAYVTDVQLGGGLLAAWGTPFANEQSDRVSVAAAGTQPLGVGTTLHQLYLDVSPSAPSGTDVPLTLSGFLCNEGQPSAQVVNGVLRIRSTTAVETTEPRRLALGRAWPNPFADRTRVTFTLPEDAGRAAVAVFAADGRRVRTLLEGAPGVGQHEVAWDGRDDGGRGLPVGVYFVRLDWAGRHLERKVVLLR
jgi:uncharacterized protein YjdB